MDTNVLNYTYAELWEIVQIDDPNDIDEILGKTNALTRKFQVTNPVLSHFFRSVQKRLIYAAQNTEHYEDTYAEDVNNEDVNNANLNNEAIDNEAIDNEAIDNAAIDNEAFDNAAIDNNDYVEAYQNMNMSNDQSQTWYQNQYLKQPDKIQTDKITDRQNTVNYLITHKFL
jgi:hypothetical protein